MRIFVAVLCITFATSIATVVVAQETATGTAQLGASAEARRPGCQDADYAFSNRFDICTVTLAALFVLVLPLLLPAVGVRRWWWLALPTERWIVLSCVGVFLFLLLIY